MSLPMPLPTIDVGEAERRLREDPARPLLLDVREPDEFAWSGHRARSCSRRPRSPPGSTSCRRTGR